MRMERSREDGDYKACSASNSEITISLARISAVVVYDDYDNKDEALR